MPPVELTIPVRRRRTRTYDAENADTTAFNFAINQALDGKADVDHGHVVDDLTDAGAAGKAEIRSETHAEARAAIGVADQALPWVI